MIKREIAKYIIIFMVAYSSMYLGVSVAEKIAYKKWDDAVVKILKAINEKNKCLE